jgi:hypothetical protein
VPRRAARFKARFKAVEAAGLCMAPLCGKPLSPEDRRVWQEAIAMLIGLKIRNGFGEQDLAAAVGKALHHPAAKLPCEDCGLKVASGAASSGDPQGGQSGPLGLAIPTLGWHPLHTCAQSPAHHLRLCRLMRGGRFDIWNHRSCHATGCRRRGRHAGVLPARRRTLGR